MKKFNKSEVASSLLMLAIQWNNLEEASTPAEKELISNKIEALEKQIFQSSNIDSIEYRYPGHYSNNDNELKAYVKSLINDVNAYPDIEIAKRSSNDELALLEYTKCADPEIKKSLNTAVYGIIDGVDKYRSDYNKNTSKGLCLVLKK